MVAAKLLAHPLASRLSRLAVVYAEPIRLKIVTELFFREMSPAQFRKEFGGLSKSAIERHFKKLTEYGWLRRVRPAREGGPGAPGNLYRATELAVFDLQTWSELPYPVRAAFSWTTFKQLRERVEASMNAGMFDARSDRHLSWTPLVLDERAWQEVIGALDALFEWLFEEQQDAKLRLASSKDERSFLSIVSLIGFESPVPESGIDQRIHCSDITPLALSPITRLDSPVPFTKRLAKLFTDPVALTIITEANLREVSATSLQEEFGGDDLFGFNRRIKTLSEYGWLVKVDEKTGGRRRGSTEYFYKATGPAVFDDASWIEVPDSVKSNVSWTTFTQLGEKVAEAISHGTFDARTDRHFSWSPFLFDQLAWEHMISALNDLFESLLLIQTEAKLRLASSPEQPLLATVSLIGFEARDGDASVF